MNENNNENDINKVENSTLETNQEANSNVTLNSTLGTNQEASSNVTINNTLETNQEVNSNSTLNSNQNNYQIPNEVMYQTENEINDEIKKEKNKMNYLKDFIVILVTVVAVLLIKKYVVTPVQVNGDSMASTLLNGDIMILDKIGYKINGIKRFDIVVINNEDTMLIKRVIGLPNEHLEVKSNVLYINGEEIKEDFLSKDNITADIVTDIPDNCYYVLGDNRDISLDSEELGCFNIDDIEGTASFTIYPFNRFGSKK